MSIRKYAIWVCMPIILCSAVSFRGHYNVKTYLRNYEYNSYSYDLYQNNVDSLHTFIVKEYNVKLRYDYRDNKQFSDYALMKIRTTGISIMASKGLLDYVRENSYYYTDGYDEEHYSSHNRICSITRALDLRRTSLNLSLPRQCIMTLRTYMTMQ